MSENTNILVPVMNVAIRNMHPSFTGYFISFVNQLVEVEMIYYVLADFFHIFTNEVAGITRQMLTVGFASYSFVYFSAPVA